MIIVEVLLTPIYISATLYFFVVEKKEAIEGTALYIQRFHGVTVHEQNYR